MTPIESIIQQAFDVVLGCCADLPPDEACKRCATLAEMSAALRMIEADRDAWRKALQGCDFREHPDDPEAAAEMVADYVVGLIRRCVDLQKRLDESREVASKLAHATRLLYAQVHAMGDAGGEFQPAVTAEAEEALDFYERTAQ